MEKKRKKKKKSNGKETKLEDDFARERGRGEIGRVKCHAYTHTRTYVHVYICTVRLNVGGARARRGGGRLSLLKLNWREAQPWKRSLDETKLRNLPQAAYKTHACVRVCPAVSYRCNEDRFLVTQSVREGGRERERGMRRERKKVATNYLPVNVHKLSCVEMRERVSSSSTEDCLDFWIFGRTTV